MKSMKVIHGVENGSWRGEFRNDQPRLDIKGHANALIDRGDLDPRTKVHDFRMIHNQSDIDDVVALTQGRLFDAPSLFNYSISNILRGRSLPHLSGNSGLALPETADHPLALEASSTITPISSVLEHDDGGGRRSRLQDERPTMTVEMLHSGITRLFRNKSRIPE
jgi:hypothetical protein